jgi:hypothetical protein
VEFLEIVNNLVCYHKKFFKNFFLLLVLFLIPFHWCAYCSQRGLDFRQLVIQLILLLILLFSIYSVPKFRESLIQHKNSFSTDATFKKTHGKYEERFYLFEQGKSTRIFKITFFLLWALASVYLVMQHCELGTFSDNCAGLYTIFLLILTLIFNAFSYYLCIIYIKFLRDNSINKIRSGYNESNPSCSLGFQQLLLSAKTQSKLFLFTSLLYSFAFLIAFSQSINNGVTATLDKEQGITFFVIIFLTFFLTIVASVAMFFAQGYYLNRILRFWKMDTLKTLENKLMQAYSKNCISCINRLSKNIETLVNDKPLAITSFPVEMSVSITTILLNVVSVFGFLNNGQGG